LRKVGREKQGGAGVKLGKVVVAWREKNRLGLSKELRVLKKSKIDMEVWKFPLTF